MNLRQKLNPAHTALVVIDIQNDSCSPFGVLAKLGKNVSGMDTLVSNIQILVSDCEKHGIPVLYTQQVYDRTKLNSLQLEQYDLDNRMVTCDIKGDGWKFFKISPPPSKVYGKYNYNIFSNPQLKTDLDAAGIKTLIVTGVSTQICVETAIRNGFDLGYKIVVPADLVATTSNDPITQERTLNLVRKTYGVVSSLEEVLDIINA